METYLDEGLIYCEECGRYIYNLSSIEGSYCTINHKTYYQCPECGGRLKIIIGVGDV